MATASTDDTRFLGLNLGELHVQWRAAGALLLDLPLLRKLVPEAPVLLHLPDGSQSCWRWARGIATPQQGPLRAPTQAVALSPGQVLTRELVLPPLAPADVERAAALEVANASPFGADETVWGSSQRVVPGQGIRVNLVIASRTYVGQAMAAAGFDSTEPPEIWHVPSGFDEQRALRPIVLAGYGEARRLHLLRRGFVQRLILLVLLLLLLIALVVTPTVLIYKRSQQAQRAFESLQQQVTPQMAEREVLMQRVDTLSGLRQRFRAQLAMEPVLAMLTRAMPDGSWLSSMVVDGNKLVLNGMADDAAALVQGLASEPGTRDVRLASPATRRSGANKESFIIELSLDSLRYGVMAVPEESEAVEVDP